MIELKVGTVQIDQVKEVVNLAGFICIIIILFE